MTQNGRETEGRRGKDRKLQPGKPVDPSQAKDEPWGKTARERQAEREKGTKSDVGGRLVTESIEADVRLPARAHPT